MGGAIQKLKITFDLKTLILIMTTVGSISFRGAGLLGRMDRIELTQNTIITETTELKEGIAYISELEKENEKKLARLEPMMDLVMDKLGL